MQQEKLAEEYVNFLTSHSLPKAMTLEEIACETKSDSQLQRLQAALRLSKWDIFSFSFYHISTQNPISSRKKKSYTNIYLHINIYI